MKSELLVTLLIAALGSLYYIEPTQEYQAPSEAQTLFQQFEEWKLDHGFNYEDEEENNYRFEVFKENVAFIEKTNEKYGEEVLGLTSLSGYTHEEYKQIFLDQTQQNHKQLQNMMPTVDKLSAQETPVSVDWVAKGAVPPPVDARRCAASYAAATASQTTSLQFIEQGVMEPLSTQQLISCDEYNGGCKGGSDLYSVIYAVQNGFMTEQDYPFTSRNGGSGRCQYTSNDVVYTPKNAYLIKSKSPQLIEQTVAKHPVIARIDGSGQEFQNWRSKTRVYSGYDCNSQDGPNYSVSVVGYNNETPKHEYWLIQSSFGPRWGDNGIMKIKKSKKGSGACDMYTEAKFTASQ